MKNNKTETASPLLPKIISESSNKKSLFQTIMNNSEEPFIIEGSESSETGDKSIGSYLASNSIL